MNYRDALYDLDVRFLTEVANLVGKQLGTPFKVREHSDGVKLNWDIQEDHFGIIFMIRDRDATHPIVEMAPTYGNGILKTASIYAIDSKYVARECIWHLKKKGVTASMVSKIAQEYIRNGR